MNLFKKLLSILTKQERKSCWKLLFCMILGGIFEAVGISVIFPLISILGDSRFLENHEKVYRVVSEFGILDHLSFVLISAKIMIFWYIIKNFYMIWLTRKQVDFIVRKQILFSKRLMAYYLRKSYLNHIEENSAILSRNLQTSVSDVFKILFVNSFFLLTESIVAIAIWLMLICIDFFTGTVMFGAFALLVYVIVRALQKKLTIQGTIQNEKAAEFTKWLNQSLEAIKETKVLRKEYFFWEAFSRAYEEYGKAQCFYTVTAQLPKFFIEACVTIGLLLLIILKLLLGVSPEEIVPLLGVLALAAFRLMPCANRIVTFWGSIKYFLPFFMRFTTILWLLRERMLVKTRLSKWEKRKKYSFLIRFRYALFLFSILKPPTRCYKVYLLQSLRVVLLVS